MDSIKPKCHCKSTSETNTACTMGTTQCCWCMDKRSVYKIYIDEYGLIEPAKHYCLMPRDLYYCSTCKYPETISVGCYTEQLKKVLPEPDIFHKRVTKAKKTVKIQQIIRMQNITERMQKIREKSMRDAKLVK